MPTFNVLDMYGALRREIYLILGQELKKMDFGHKQMQMLFHLGSKGRCSMGELASLTLSDKATVTRAVDSMERSDLLRREPDENDNRITLIRLTAKGKAQAERAQKLREAIGTKLNACLSSSEQKQLTELLAKVVQGLKSQRGESES